jgi:MFS family permease
MADQRWLRIIPVALIMYTIAFIDRTNVSMALRSMSRDLGMDPAQAGNVAGAFFWGYLLLQIPAGHLAEQWSAKRLISVFLVAWGIGAVGCGLVRTWQQLWVMRFLLGVAEGGVYPATLVLISHWFLRQERARANALWMVCLPFAVVVSSPLSGWILDHWNWRVMLIAEGALPFIWLAVWVSFINDYPREARWVTGRERERLAASFNREAMELESAKPDSILRALVRPQVLLLILIYFFHIGAEIGYLIWLPSALKSAKSLSNVGVGLLFTIPFIVGAISMVVNSWHSDKSGERRNHVAGALLSGGLFLIAGVVASSHWPALAFVFICLAGIGTYASMGPFWAIPTETLPRDVLGPAMGLVNAIGNLGGFFGPLAVGYLNKRTGNFLYGFGLLGTSYLVAGALAFLLNPARAPVKVMAAA